MNYLNGEICVFSYTYSYTYKKIHDNLCWVYGLPRGCGPPVEKPRPFTTSNFFL